jgi:hypothetical protein
VARAARPTRAPLLHRGTSSSGPLSRTSAGSDEMRERSSRLLLLDGTIGLPLLDRAPLAIDLDNNRQRRVEGFGCGFTPGLDPGSRIRAWRCSFSMGTRVSGLFGPRPRPLTMGFVSGVGAQTGRQWVVDGNCTGSVSGGRGPEIGRGPNKQKSSSWGSGARGMTWAWMAAWNARGIRLAAGPVGAVRERVAHGRRSAMAREAPR